MKLLDGRIDLENYNVQIFQDESQKIKTVTFKTEDLLDLVSDIEGLVASDLTEGEEYISHEEVLQTIDFTPEKLKEIRTKHLKLTQKELGDAIGYSEGAIRHAEKGRKTLKYRMIKAILNLFYNDNTTKTQKNDHSKMEHYGEKGIEWVPGQI